MVKLKDGLKIGFNKEDIAGKALIKHRSNQLPYKVQDTNGKINTT